MKLKDQELYNYLVRFYSILSERYDGHMFEKIQLKLFHSYSHRDMPFSFDRPKFTLKALDGNKLSFSFKIGFREFLHCLLVPRAHHSRAIDAIELELTTGNYLDEDSLATARIPFKLTFNAYTDADRLIELLEKIEWIRYAPPIFIKPRLDVFSKP